MHLWPVINHRIHAHDDPYRFTGSYLSCLFPATVFGVRWTRVGIDFRAKKNEGKEMRDRVRRLVDRVIYFHVSIRSAQTRNREIRGKRIQRKGETIATDADGTIPLVSY